MVPSKRLKELEREIAELKAVELLVGGLAHDFNNLLTAIAGHAALLEADAEPGSETAESTTAIRKATEHAAVIVGRLQDITHRGSIRREPVDLHETIGEVSALLKPMLNGNIRIEQDLVASGARTLGDPVQMHQLIVNLALNAADSMPDGGSLVFRTSLDQESDPPQVVVAITDTGCGIPEENRERIFEPFFTTRESGKGTGLGLAVVSRIVKQHSGRIEVESGMGTGTTFRVYFPLLETGIAASA